MRKFSSLLLLSCAPVMSLLAINSAAAVSSAAMLFVAPAGMVGHSHAGAKQSPADDPLATLQAPERLFTCSMHPQIRLSDPAARCPICGMALIPVPDEVDHPAATAAVGLRLNARAAALLQTQVTPVQQAIAKAELTLPGVLAADQSRVQTISAWTGGRIEQAYINSTAQQVTAGAPMLEIFSPDLIVIQQELLQAKQLAGKSSSLPAKATLDSARRRLRLLGVPASQIEAILQSERLQDTVTVSAPVSGIVTEKWQNQGAYVTAGQALFTVLALDKLWLEVEVFEEQLPLISKNAELAIRFAALPGETFHSKVELIEPVLNSNSRTARVRASVANPNGHLKPGMFALVNLQQTLPSALLVPASAVLFTGKQSLVYVQPDAAQPYYQPRSVTLGQRVGEVYQVLSGLTAGELVVSQGAFRLDSELQIRGLPSMLSASEVTAATNEQLTEASVATVKVDKPVAASQWQLSKEQHAAILSGYQQAYQGLVADDLALWQHGTVAFQQAVADISWPDHYPRIISALQASEGHIMHVADLIEARALFYRHNLGLLRLAELGLLGDGWYEAHCPMARDGEGASWLQPSAELQNPYFGQMMLRCGDVLRQFSVEAH